MLTYREQDSLDNENYETLVKLSLDQRRPVLLDILDFCPESGDLYIDLSDCYRAIYSEYQTCLRETRVLVDLLQANLWSTWCQKNAKYWGKKRAGKHVEGLLIDVVEYLTLNFEESYGDFEPVFAKFDLYRRKLQAFELSSLQNFSLTKGLNFDSSYRAMPPSWRVPRPQASIYTAYGAPMIRHTKHRANYDATIQLMVELFNWTSPGGMGEKILKQHDYEEMLETWYTGMVTAWKQTRIADEY